MDPVRRRTSPALAATGNGRQGAHESSRRMVGHAVACNGLSRSVRRSWLVGAGSIRCRKVRVMRTHRFWQLSPHLVLVWGVLALGALALLFTISRFGNRASAEPDRQPRPFTLA